MNEQLYIGQKVFFFLNVGAQHVKMAATINVITSSFVEVIYYTTTGVKVYHKVFQNSSNGKIPVFTEELTEKEIKLLYI